MTHFVVFCIVPKDDMPCHETYVANTIDHYSEYYEECEVTLFEGFEGQEEVRTFLKGE